MEQRYWHHWDLWMGLVFNLRPSLDLGLFCSILSLLQIPQHPHWYKYARSSILAAWDGSYKSAASTPAKHKYLLLFFFFSIQKQGMTLIFLRNDSMLPTELISVPAAPSASSISQSQTKQLEQWTSGPQVPPVQQDNHQRVQ